MTERYKNTVFVVLLLMAGAAGLNWSVSPERGLLWGSLIAVAVLAAAVNAFLLNARTDRGRERHAVIRRSLVMGSLLIVLSFLVRLAGEYGVTEATEKRIALVLIGLFLAATGNYLPKTVLPIAAQGRNPARRANAERITGRIFVLCGLAFAVAALAVPLDYVTLATGAFGMIAFLSAIFAWFWVAGGRQQTQED